MTLNCAVYTRQSVKTESDLTSCDVQREMCLQFLRSQRRPGLELLALDERFDDEGRSGANANRPALQRILGLIRVGAIQAVFIQRLDRLSRKVADSAKLLHQFKKHGVRLFIVAMPELAASAHDTFMLNMLAAFAEFERDMIADRIRDARAGLVARGQRIAGVVPYGYSAHPTTKQLVAVAEEASIVKQLFELVAENIPPSGAARIAAEKGWRTRGGRPWTARQVLDTVTNPVYSGRFRARKETRAGVHAPIIDSDLFQRCAEAIAARRTHNSGRRTRHSAPVLAQKVRCAKCLQLMGARVTRNGVRGYTYFRCRKAVDGRGSCTGTQIRAYDIEETVRFALMSPASAFPRKRGRPGKDVRTLYALCQVIPLLDPAAEPGLIRNVVQEVVWNAEKASLRILLNWEMLASGLRKLSSQVEAESTDWDE